MAEIKAERLAVDARVIDQDAAEPLKPAKSKARSRDKDAFAGKRRCVSTACIACRRRKSKCDGNKPSCAACASVYGTECVYDPNSDHRRTGVYKKDIDNLKTRNSTLQTLIEAILNYPEHEVPQLIRQIRTCESLDDVAEEILAKDATLGEEAEDFDSRLQGESLSSIPRFEAELSGKMGELKLENGTIQFVGGTSNLLYLDSGLQHQDVDTLIDDAGALAPDDAFRSWTTVTSDTELIVHLMNMYTTWHYPYFTTLSKSLFFRDFFQGKPRHEVKGKNVYCTSLLVNAMLALGCHFTSKPAARADPRNSATIGDHFFKEAKRIILENDEHENPRLPTVQALALMSVREAGCGREAKGWVYSGMSFRMAFDLGLNVDEGTSHLDEQEVDARRITFWGCFLFDKCWSNYLGRPPQLPRSNVTVPKFDVFPEEDAELWFPWTDTGASEAHVQPARTRAVALQISSLCEISNDLLFSFYHPTYLEKPLGRQAELKKLSELHTRLEAWKKNLPKELEAKEGQLPNVLVMHMFYNLLFIHLFRPFLKYNQANSPLPAHVSPRRLCTHAATMVSKLLRIYKRTYGLNQICNIAVYIAHSACTIHLLNLPEKGARRDIIHGLRHLEEIADFWLCARRTLGILNTQIRRWNIELPEEALVVLARVDVKFDLHGAFDHQSPGSLASTPVAVSETIPHKPNGSTQYANLPDSMNGISNGLPNGFRAGNPHSPSTIHRSGTGSPQTIPLQQPGDFGNIAQQHHMMPSTSQILWSQDRSPSDGIPLNKNSPTIAFGGADQIFEESREWWMKDQSTLFDNWGPNERDGVILGNPLVSGNGRIGTESGMGGMLDSNGANGMGYMGFGANSYGFE